MKPKNLFLCHSCVQAIKANIKLTDLFHHKQIKCEMCGKKNFVNLYRLEDFTDEDDRERGS